MSWFSLFFWVSFVVCVCLSLPRSAFLSFFVPLANMFNICPSILLQKLWIEHLSAFLITDSIDYGFSNSASDTPQSVMKKQRLLNILPHSAVYNLPDGRITTDSPYQRNVLGLGDFEVIFSCFSCQTAIAFNRF